VLVPRGERSGTARAGGSRLVVTMTISGAVPQADRSGRRNAPDRSTGASYRAAPATKVACRSRLVHMFGGRATPLTYTAGTVRFYLAWSEPWRRIRDSNS
jgi:hypothetical protein